LVVGGCSNIKLVGAVVVVTMVPYVPDGHCYEAVAHVLRGGWVEWVGAGC
jgi:hypothetical protein